MILSDEQIKEIQKTLARSSEAFGPNDLLNKKISDLIESLEAARAALVWCKEFLEARDAMNSKIHCAPVRLSPLTIRVQSALGEGGK